MLPHVASNHGGVSPSLERSIGEPEAHSGIASHPALARVVFQGPNEGGPEEATRCTAHSRILAAAAPTPSFPCGRDESVRFGMLQHDGGRTGDGEDKERAGGEVPLAPVSWCPLPWNPPADMQPAAQGCTAVPNPLRDVPPGPRDFGSFRYSYTWKERKHV